MTKQEIPPKLSCLEQDLYDLNKKRCIAENKLKQYQDITDEDIELYARRHSLSEVTERGIILGAKAMRDGEIKHKEK